MKKTVNNFELQSPIFAVDGQPCRLYLPTLVVEKKKYCWVEFQDNRVELVPEEKLKYLKNGKILYAKK